jgi:hypothetical protein
MDFDVARIMIDFSIDGRMDAKRKVVEAIDECVDVFAFGDVFYGTPTVFPLGHAPLDRLVEEEWER